MKVSEQLRELVKNWREHTLFGEPYASRLEAIIPAVEQLKQAEWKGRLEELELCTDSPMPILEWYGRRKPFLLQKLGGAE